MERIKEIYNYRQMIFRLVRKDLRGRYKGSVLGFFWTFLNPLLQLLVYTMVFSVIMRSGIDKYYLFLFCGAGSVDLFQLFIDRGCYQYPGFR
ncbi:MAG: ABC transporter permease [Roseburia hominis]